MRNYYTPVAEFYDMVAARQSASSGPALAAALAGLDTSTGPVMEIGAGTGRIVRVIGQALPQARIVASEPSAAMRAVLTSRVVADPDLRDRVTVVDGAAPDLPLPERLSAAVVFGVAGHLPPAQRSVLWRRLRERLAPGGLIAVELMGRTPRQIPPTRWLHETIGRQEYEWWVAGEPGGADLMRFTTTWRVRHGDRVVREISDDYDWWRLDTARLATESGLPSRRIRHVGGELVPEIGILSRPPAPEPEPAAT